MENNDSSDKAMVVNDADKAIRNILIVDASSENIERISEALHDCFDISFAMDAPSAVQQMRDSEPDVVLMSIVSISADVVSLCGECRVPVILLCRELAVDTLIAGFQAGAAEILSCDVGKKELCYRICAQISLHEMRSEPVNRVGAAKPAVQDPAELEEQKGKVLLVDDSVSNIQVLNEILCQDYDVFFATNGKQAISMALDEQPDLVVLDVVMPQMDGYSVCEQLKSMQETKDIGIIFVTSLNDVEDEAKGLQMGAIDYITKPFSAHIVRARMHNHMELVRHRKMLSGLSMTDALTSIANRRQFDQVMHRELHRAVRQREPLTLMLLDIDHFKKYNDTYGHVNGDECLKEVAAALDDCRARMTDFVARYGGEEFAFILPNTSKEGASLMSEKILAAIRGLSIAHEDNNGLGIVTLSIGVYCAIPEYKASKESLVERADEALYRAKALGRNCAVFAEVQS